MKSLTNFINEAIEWEEPENNGYGVVTLVRRENLKLSKITKEDFVKFIKEDLKEAIKEYANICKPINDKRKNDYIEDQVKAATKFAEKKWKTEKKRKEYIENIRKNAESQKLYFEESDRIFFDLKPDKGRMGIPQCCIISKKSKDADLEDAYDEMMHSKYFKRGTGWAFKYESLGKNRPYAFRPYIDILLDETSREEQRRDEESLANAVQNFYANSNYWGD